MTPPATVPAGDAAVAWSRERWARVGEYDVRYREAGDGPALVLVHGLGLSADFWWRNGPPLAAAGFHVLAPDLPGFGKTEGPPHLTVAEQARWVAAWADAIGLGPAAYAGHSVSCQAALELAADRPERVTALVLAAPTGDPAPFRLLRQALGFVADPVFEPMSLVPAVAEPYLRAGLVRWLRTWIAAGRHDALPLCPAVSVPALVIVGHHDPVVRRGFARELANAFPHCRMTILPRGAHAVVFDAADEFNREVADFLGEVLAMESPGSSETRVSHESTGSTESTESTESTGSTGSTGSTESTESTGSSRTSESAGSRETSVSPV